MINENLQVTNTNLSLAWAEAFLASIASGVDAVSPLTINVININDKPAENLEIRNILDKTLLDYGVFKVHTTANTIFPMSLWNREKDSDYLYERYKKILPDLKKADTHNKYGLYFQRLIDYGPNHRNQLKFIINSYQRDNHRKSALQAAIFDPNLDQTNQRTRGFPCLQQVAFIPNPKKNELTVHGFYATQYLFERAYGNLLGLSNLGLFVATQLGLKFTKVSCTAAFAKYGDLNKGKLKNLENEIKRLTYNA